MTAVEASFGSQLRRQVFKAWQDKRMMVERKEGRPTAGTAGRDGIILPPDPAIPRQVAPQQSLLPFHRTGKRVTSSAECHENFKTRQTRLPGPGCLNSSGPIKETQFALETRAISRQNRVSKTSIRYPKVFLPAGFNAPISGWF